MSGAARVAWEIAAAEYRARYDVCCGVEVAAVALLRYRHELLGRPGVVRSWRCSRCGLAVVRVPRGDGSEVVMCLDCGHVVWRISARAVRRRGRRMARRQARKRRARWAGKGGVK